MFAGLLSILEAHQIAPTLNPECDGMKTATTNLQQGILTLLKKPSSCEPNPHCTGDIDGAFSVCFVAVKLTKL